MITIVKRSCFIVLALYLMTKPVFSQHEKKTYILVHSQWQGSWIWSKVVPILEEKGYRAIAFDLPGHGADPAPVENVTLEDCVQKVVTVANAQPGQVILVGHSSAGVIIAQASEILGKNKVASLVFLDAFLPNDGESVFILAEKYASSGTPLSQIFHVSKDHKTVSLDLDGVKELLYHDCHQAVIDFAKANLRQGPIAVLATPVRLTNTNYGDIPKFYIRCTEARDMDKTELAKNVPCQKVYALPSSHSPFFSMPETLTGILQDLD